MIKIMFAIGTRPEAIKMAPIINECRRYKDIAPIIVATSQHGQLLKQTLKIFGIIPDFDFKIMRKEQTLFDVTIKILNKMEKLIESINPHILLVQGDTTTVFACSLAAYYKKIDVGHVEAGLRSFDKYNPFPEELNRKLTDMVSDIHFAPTKTAKDNLLKEGVDIRSIHVTGNPVIDSLFQVLEKKRKNNTRKIDWNKKIILVTSHRRESFGRGLFQIASALKKIAKKNKGVEIVFPVHPNPKVKNIMCKMLSGVDNIKLLRPVGYVAFVNIMQRSTIILTDSGGVQEEAPSLGIPVLVLREVTERPEAVNAGCVKVIGTETKKIVREVEILLNNDNIYNSMARAINPYGDGKAAKRIIDIIRRKYT